MYERFLYRQSELYQHRVLISSFVLLLSTPLFIFVVSFECTASFPSCSLHVSSPVLLHVDFFSQAVTYRWTCNLPVFFCSSPYLSLSSVSFIFNDRPSTLPPSPSFISPITISVPRF